MGVSLGTVRVLGVLLALAVLELAVQYARSRPASAERRDAAAPPRAAAAALRPEGAAAPAAPAGAGSPLTPLRFDVVLQTGWASEALRGRMLVAAMRQRAAQIEATLGCATRVRLVDLVGDGSTADRVRRFNAWQAELVYADTPPHAALFIKRAPSVRAHSAFWRACAVLVLDLLDELREIERLRLEGRVDLQESTPGALLLVQAPGTARMLARALHTTFHDEPGTAVHRVALLGHQHTNVLGWRARSAEEAAARGVRVVGVLVGGWHNLPERAELAELAAATCSAGAALLLVFENGAAGSSSRGARYLCSGELLLPADWRHAPTDRRPDAGGAPGGGGGGALVSTRWRAPGAPPSAAPCPGDAVLRALPPLSARPPHPHPPPRGADGTPAAAPARAAGGAAGGHGAPPLEDVPGLFNFSSQRPFHDVPWVEAVDVALLWPPRLRRNDSARHRPATRLLWWWTHGVPALFYPYESYVDVARAHGYVLPPAARVPSARDPAEVAARLRELGASAAARAALCRAGLRAARAYDPGTVATRLLAAVHSHTARARAAAYAYHVEGARQRAARGGAEGGGDDGPMARITARACERHPPVSACQPWAAAWLRGAPDGRVAHVVPQMWNSSTPPPLESGPDGGDESDGAGGGAAAAAEALARQQRARSGYAKLARELFSSRGW